MNKKIVNEMLNIAIDNIEAITEPKDKVIAISAFLTMVNEILPGGVESLENGDDEEEEEPKQAMKKETSKKNSKASSKKEAKTPVKEEPKESEEENEEEVTPIFIVDDSDVSISEDYKENEFAVWLLEVIEYYGLDAINEELMVFSANVCNSVEDLEEEGLEAFVSHLSAKIEEEGDEE